MGTSNAVKEEQNFAENEVEFPDELQAGTKLLGGQYTIVKFLNSGGFGITYLAKDSLDRDVVIKECFPDSICRRSTSIVRARSRAHSASFASIVDLFVQEARSQAKLVHPNIVGVHQVFHDNDTAYMAIDFIDGGDLLEKIEKNETLDPKNVEHWLRSILGAVGFIHDDGMLHRDISPDNILIDKENKPVLIDFGAAREQASKTNRVLSTMRVVKDGYSPQEFYVAGSTQSPSSDLYALAATFYHAVTGEAPADSQTRLAGIAQDQKDIYEPLVGRFDNYPKAMLASIDKALSVLPKDRCQSAQEWLDMLDEKKPAKSKPAKPAAAGATDGTKKSSKGALLAAASVAALVAVGAVAFTMSSGDEPAAVAEAEVTAPGVVETAAVTPVEPAEPKVETPVVADKVEAKVEPVKVAKKEPVEIKAAKPAPIVITADNPVTTTKAAVTPKASVESPLIAKSGWTVDTPFETSEVSVKEGTFALVSLVRPNLDPAAQAWLKSGSIIYSVNGAIVYDSPSIAGAIAGSTNLAEQDFATVNVRARASKSSPIETHALTLPVVFAVELQNGFRFTSISNDKGWETRVARIPSGANTTLQVGDVIISEAQTNTVMQSAEDLELAIAKLGESSAQSAYFTITRKGKLDSATVSLGSSS